VPHVVRLVCVVLVWLVAAPSAAQWELEVEGEVRIKEAVDEVIANATLLRETHLWGYPVGLGGGGGSWWTEESKADDPDEGSEGRVWLQQEVGFLQRWQWRSRMEVRFDHDPRLRNRLRYLQDLGVRWALLVSEEAVGYRQWRTQAGVRWYLGEIGKHVLDTVYMARYRPDGHGWDHLAVVKLILRP
jgi:hypothetical protein